MTLIKTFESQSTVASAPSDAKIVNLGAGWCSIAWGPLSWYPNEADTEVTETYGYFFRVGRLSFRWYSIGD